MNRLTEKAKIKIRGGDNGPLAEVFKAHYAYCVDHVKRQVNTSRIEAEDLMMDAMQVLRDKACTHTFEHDNLRAFLIVTAVNKWRNKQKRDSKSLSLDVSKVERYLYNQEHNGSAGRVGLTIEQEDKIDAIVKARHRLGPSCQRLLDLHFDQGYTLKELVVELGYKSYDAVKVTKYKCVKQLKKYVSEMMKD